MSLVLSGHVWDWTNIIDCLLSFCISVTILVTLPCLHRHFLKRGISYQVPNNIPQRGCYTFSHQLEVRSGIERQAKHCNIVRFEVLTAVLLEIQVFWDIAPCWPVFVIDWYLTIGTSDRNVIQYERRPWSLVAHVSGGVCGSSFCQHQYTVDGRCFLNDFGQDLEEGICGLTERLRKTTNKRREDSRLRFELGTSRVQWWWQFLCTCL
jgi:hypothetical protein